MRKLLFLPLLLLFGLHQGQAQKANLNEGIVVYELSIEGMPQVEMYVNGTTLTYSFNPSLSKMDLSFMQGMARFQMISEAAKTGTVLLDIPFLSEKTAIKMDPESEEWKALQEKALQNAPSGEQPEIKLVRKKGKKRIAGQKCQRMGLELGGQLPTGGAEIDVFVAKKLRPAGLKEWSEKIKLQNLEGLPLGFEIRAQGVTVRLMAKEVKKVAPAASTFEVSPDYQVKTFKEFQESFQEKMGGINPGGIGL